MKSIVFLLTYLLITVPGILLFSQIESSAQSHIQKIADDQINITIERSDIEGISILQGL